LCEFSLAVTLSGVVDYVYVESRGAHGHHAVGSFDAFVEKRREIWIGSDCSGMIRETSGPVSFFTPDGEARWRAAGSPDLEGSGLDLFAPGCIGAPRSELAQLPLDPTRLAGELSRRVPLTLRRVYNLLGESLVDRALCQAFYDVASRLDGVEVLGETTDQTGRVGLGLARVERGERVEVIFDSDASELLAYQLFLTDASHGYAPVGTLVSWAAFIHRELVESLPTGTPPVPGPPCSPAGGGRGTLIERDFLLGTGYFEELEPQLEEWRAAGVITAAQYRAVRDRDLPAS
jgi:hypothetical protein